MALAERLSEYVRACFTGIWIQSHEQQDALSEIAALCQRENWQVATWDIDRGLSVCGREANTAGQDPLAAIRMLTGMAVPEGAALLVLQNFHRFLQSAEIIQAVMHQLQAGKQSRTFVVALAPVVSIPVELEKLFVVLEHELPNREQLAAIARGIATESEELPSGTELDTVLEAAAGLTRYEAEGAFSLALVRHGRLAPQEIWGLKGQTLNKSGLLTLYRGQDTFERLGGLHALKAFCRRALLSSSRNNSRTRPRGVMLLSPPGCGKSAFCKALGQETGRPVLVMDVGVLMGSLVGQTEERTRQALRIADAMGSCVLMLDEVDKCLAGVTGSTDSGVSARMFGTLLTWLAEHTSDVFVCCCANDISRLPPEFTRAERFDAVFFLDLPQAEDRQAIWQLYLKQFELDTSQRLPADEGWTGAEIRACCRLAALLDLPLIQAAQNIVPVSLTSAESLDRLRQWASGRCLDADLPGIFRHRPSSKRARVMRSGGAEPSSN